MHKLSENEENLRLKLYAKGLNDREIELRQKSNGNLKLVIPLLSWLGFHPRSIKTYVYIKINWESLKWMF